MPCKMFYWKIMKNCSATPYLALSPPTSRHPCEPQDDWATRHSVDRSLVATEPATGNTDCSYFVNV